MWGRCHGCKLFSISLHFSRLASARWLLQPEEDCERQGSFLASPDCSVLPRGGGTVSAASSDPCRVLQAAAGLGRPQPGRAARRKGLEPRAPSSSSSRWRVCASGWGCGGGRGRGRGEGRVRRRRQRPTCGQLKKSRLGLPQNLWELRAARTARTEQSGGGYSLAMRAQTGL